MSTQPITNDQNERTDIAFWDDQWTERGQRSWSVRLLHGNDYGKRGMFLWAWRRLVGRDTVRGKQVLEIGGASSKYLVDLAQHEGARVVAVDYSDVGVAQTKALFAKSGINGEAICHDIFTFTGHDGESEVVTHYGVIEHFSDPLPILQASARLTRVGGHVLFNVPNLGAVGARLWRRYSPENFSAHVYHSPDALRAACEQAGLEVERMWWCGPPLVRMAPLERGGVSRHLVNGVHAALCALGTLVPPLYRRMPARLASIHYVVARRVR